MSGYGDELFRTIYLAVSPNANLSATLVDANQLAISGRIVTFGFRLYDPTNTQLFKNIPNSTPTDTMGNVVVGVTGLTTGTKYEFQAMFVGDTNYASSSIVVPYTTATGGPDNTSLSYTITPTNIFPSSVVQMAITLVDTTSNMGIAAGVTVTIDGVALTPTPQTDASGHVTITLPTLGVGQRSISASYSGDATHSNFGPVTTTITVQSPGGTALTAGFTPIALVALVAAAGAFYLYNSRGPKRKTR